MTVVIFSADWSYVLHSQHDAFLGKTNGVAHNVVTVKRKAKSVGNLIATFLPQSRAYPNLSIILCLVSAERIYCQNYYRGTYLLAVFMLFLHVCRVKRFYVPEMVRDLLSIRSREYQAQMKIGERSDVSFRLLTHRTKPGCILSLLHAGILCDCCFYPVRASSFQATLYKCLYSFANKKRDSRQ